MTDNVVPIRASAETLELHRGLVDAIRASGESFTDSVAVIRSNDYRVTPELLSALERAHLRLVSVATLLAEQL